MQDFTVETKKNDILGTVKPLILKAFKQAEFEKIDDLSLALPPGLPGLCPGPASSGGCAPRQTLNSSFVLTQSQHLPRALC